MENKKTKWDERSSFARSALFNSKCSSEIKVSYHHDTRIESLMKLSGQQ